jgi:nucleotide-binding universal stress UspA family protein
MYKSIVVGVSKTETARAAAGVAVDLANLTGAALHLVSTYDEAGARKLGLPARDHTESFLEAIAGRVQGEARVHAMPGDPADAILQVAEECGADLVVVGNKGMHGAGRVLGSVPNAVSHRAPCSVLIVATT